MRQGSSVEVKAAAQAPRATAWQGRMQCLDFDIEPDDLSVSEEVSRVVGSGNCQIKYKDASLDLSVMVKDIMARRMSVTRDAGAKPVGTTVSLTLHEFPSPGPPRGITLSL